MARASDCWIDIIEASYTIERDETEWLRGVLRAAAPRLEHGRGSYAVAYCLSANGIEARALASFDLPEGNVTVANVLGRCKRKTIEAPTHCGTASQLMGASFEHQTAIDKFKARGVRDTLGINVRDTTPFGCIFAGLLPEVTVLSPREITRWKKISAHVASGYRLQRKRAARKADAAERFDAVLSASGRVEHAEADAKAKDARADLRAAVLAFESARKHRADAVDLRKGLVSARWTLLEHFEADGRRYLVARENAPASEGPLSLTPRERQVLSHAALGQSNKLIAYQLGLAWSTVRVLLGRVASKLGTVKRAETVAAFRAMSRAHGTNGEGAEMDDSFARD